MKLNLSGKEDILILFAGLCEPETAVLTNGDDDDKKLDRFICRSNSAAIGNNKKPFHNNSFTISQKRGVYSCACVCVLSQSSVCS